MKRQYIHALLIGVLTVATVGTLTSCKEYDGDISDLREQVERAALKTDLETLQATVKNVQSADSITAANAKKAIETLDAHDLAQMENSIKDNAQKVADAIESTNTDIQNLKAENQKAVDEAAAKISADMKEQLEKWGGSLDGYYTAKEINEKLDSLKEAVNKVTDDQLADLKKTVESYKTNINALYSAVTGVSLYLNSSTTDWQLQFVSGTVAQDYDFGKKETAANDTVFTATPIVSYKKGAAINLPTELKIRVSPVNATLTPNMIKLVDSEGNNLDDILQVKSVEKVVGLHTKATQGTGLWSVYLQVKDGVDAEKTTRMSGDKYIAYAVAVNNTATAVDTAAISSADASSRYVVSAYDLILKGTTAYNTTITTLDNIKVAAESEADDESSWMALSKWSTKTEGENPVLGVQNGENIRLDLSALRNQADRFYVAVDYSDTDQKSDMTEYNAWKSYQYTNLNKVYEVSTENPTISVTINGQADDEVQFRLFVVNYDGTPVSEHGAPFRVKVGAQTNIVTVEGDLRVATGDDGATIMETGWLPISQILKTGATLPTTIGFSGNSSQKISVAVSYAEDAEGKTTFIPADDKDNTKAKYAKFTLSDNLTFWPDGESLTAYMKDAAVPVINKFKVTLKKVMPMAEDAKRIMGYSWKAGYLVDGTYMAYMMPFVKFENQKWDADKNTFPYVWYINLPNLETSYGYAKMNDVINIDKDAIGTKGYIEIENAEENNGDQVNGKAKYTSSLIVNPSSKENRGYDLWAMIPRANADGAGTLLVDSKTKHKSEVKYNFGAISSQSSNDYVVIADTYNTIFACPLDESVQKFSWTQAVDKPATATKPAEMKDVNFLTYPSTMTVTAFPTETATWSGTINLLNYIKATNSVSPGYLNKTLYASLYGQADNWRYPQEQTPDAHLYTKGTTNEEYYTVKILIGAKKSEPEIQFTKVGDIQPTKDVESTLVIKLKCAFGHTHTYELPFWVKAPK